MEIKDANVQEAKLSSFETFWPYYLGEHAHPANRHLHVAGTSLGLLLWVAVFVLEEPLLAPAAVMVGYGFAWVGHFFIEKNRPATFTYPLWSLVGDFKMWGMFCTGRLGNELTRLGIGGPG